jgi:preprotein translocase SecE subunit
MAALTTSAREFVKEAWVELTTKVSRPSRNELRDSTIVVIVTCLILTAFVWIADTILTLAIGLFFQ